jgi:hypothetical protein
MFTEPFPRNDSGTVISRSLHNNSSTRYNILDLITISVINISLIKYEKAQIEDALKGITDLTFTT